MVLENNDYKLLWDYNIQTDHQISARRSDLVVINKQEQTCQVIDIAVTEDTAVRAKEEENVGCPNPGASRWNADTSKSGTSAVNQTWELTNDEPSPPMLSPPADIGVETPEIILTPLFAFNDGRNLKEIRKSHYISFSKSEFSQALRFIDFFKVKIRTTVVRKFWVSRRKLLIHYMNSSPVRQSAYLLL